MRKTRKLIDGLASASGLSLRSRGRKTATAPVVPTIKSSQFAAEVINADLPVFVQFSADWCPACKKQKPVTETVAPTYAGRVKFVYVDTDNSPKLSGQHNVERIPTLVIFKGGLEVARNQGGLTEAALKVFINRAIADNA